LKKKSTGDQSEKRIGVHCAAGMGRAPFLVALALVKRGCQPDNAIDLIRKHRSGALNLIQANYILEMEPPKESGGCNCTIF